MEKLLSISEVEEQLGLLAWRLYDLAAKGAIPIVRIGMRIYFSHDQFVTWIESGGQSAVTANQQAGSANA